jgi:hypothetical protein
MEKLELNLYGVSEIKSFGTTGLFFTEFGQSKFSDEIDEIIEFLDDNKYDYELSYPYKDIEDMPQDEWLITIKE